MKKSVLAGVASVALMAATMIGSIADAEAMGRGSGPIIYVRSQGLYFDSIVLTGLPFKGDFQELEATMNGLETDFGPGEPGHLGGRWWMDSNPNGVMDPHDSYFMCPLLGPGREAP
jgi:hypothetical protein